MTNLLLFLILLELMGAGAYLRKKIKRHRKAVAVVLFIGYAVSLVWGLWQIL